MLYIKASIHQGINIETQTRDHGVTIVSTSGPASRSRYAEMYHNWRYIGYEGSLQNSPSSYTYRYVDKCV